MKVTCHKPSSAKTARQGYHTISQAAAMIALDNLPEVSALEQLVAKELGTAPTAYEEGATFYIVLAPCGWGWTSHIDMGSSTLLKLSATDLPAVLRRAILPALEKSCTPAGPLPEEEATDSEEEEEGSTEADE